MRKLNQEKIKLKWQREICLQIAEGLTVEK